MWLTAGFGQITWRGTNESNGQMFMTSVGFIPVAVGTDDLAEIELAFWGDLSFGGLVWEGWHSQGVQVKIGTSDPHEPITLEGAAGAEGAATGSPSTPQCSVLLKKLTNRGGRHGRGRMYIPGPQEAWVDGGGFVDPAGMSAYQDALEVFLEVFSTASWSDGLVLLHSDAAGGAPNPIVDWFVEPVVATQRRRLRG